MKFDITNIAMDPFILMFFTVSTGLLLGIIKIKRFNLGVSGTLFTGLLIGWAVYRYGMNIIGEGRISPGYDTAVRMVENGVIHPYFFNASLVFFVAAVGLLAAKDIGFVLKKYGVKFVALGILITFAGAASTFGATLLIHNANPYETAGVYTGALTSLPGLGAALEAGKNHAESYVNNYSLYDVKKQKEILSFIDSAGYSDLENVGDLSEKQKKIYVNKAEASVGVGHAIGYPFGVIIVILAVNFLPVLFKMDIEEEKRWYIEEMHKASDSRVALSSPEAGFSLISFALTCITGYLMGSLEIYMGPIGYFSLGATGGVLIMGLILGYIGKAGPISFRMEPKMLSLIREIGLAFFLAVVGLKYGFMAFNTLMKSGVILALASLLIGMLSILAGFFVGRYVFKLNWVMLAGAICGGMTSTPGLGAAIDALDSDDPAAGYGATYPFALLGMIIFTILLHKLPVY